MNSLQRREWMLAAGLACVAMWPVVAAGGVVAHFDFSGPMAETPQDMPPLFASEMPVAFKDMLARLRAAREDKNVVAVILEVENAGLGTAQLEELRLAVRKFQAVDKPVYVHADSLSTGTYALATSATHISITPTGDLWLTGLHGEAPYLRGMLDKLGVVPDFLQCGDFKSAGEIFMRTGPSESAEKMENWLFDGIYEGIVAMIAEGRGLSADKVKAAIDGGPYSAEEALKAGLIEAVEHRQDFIARLKSKYGGDVEFQRDYGERDLASEMPSDPFTMLSKVFEMLTETPKHGNKPAIAIVYVEGAIETGEAEFSPFGGSSGAFSTTIRKALDKAGEDENIKAVVLRVDSPGGSALASEIILDAVRRVQKKKPVIVSMGNVAGSGGYYVACSGEMIFADATTITASIGVIGGKLVTTGGWNKLGINWHSYQRGKMAGMMSSEAPWSDAERAKMTQYMNTIYGVFKNHVTEFRGKKLTKPIDEMAGGRVYTGSQALALGLIDKIGGLSDAVKYASEKANVSDFELRVLPEQPNIFKMLFGMEDEGYAQSSVATGLFAPQSQFISEILPVVKSLDPQRAGALMTAIKRLQLINDEKVIMMMPSEWVIR